MSPFKWGLAPLLAALMSVIVMAGIAHAKAGHKHNPAADAAAAAKNEKAREVDDAYKAALKTIDDKPKKDPWSGMR